MTDGSHNGGGLMCRAKSDPNYFRCEWKNATSRQLADRLVDEATALGATVIADVLGPDNCDALDSLLDGLERQLAEAIGTLGTKEAEKVRKDLRQPGRRKLAKGHLVCAIAAAIGEACHEIGSVTDSVAKAIGQEVTERTGSRLVGKVSELAARKWLSTLPATSPLGQVKQVGLIADTIAVCACPSQQDGGIPGSHPQVVLCEGRLTRKVVKSEVEGILEQASPR